MKLSQVIIVLCNPDESQNVGAVCRAMLTMDITKLRIVGKRENYDIDRVNMLALHAKHLFENAQFFDSLEEATSDCILIAGTTRRTGQKRKKLLLPHEFTTYAFTIPDAKSDTEGLLALVFGNERTGLIDSELDICTMGVTIPTSSQFGSLNLAQAVQIFTYELHSEFIKRGTNNSNKESFTPLSINQLDKTLNVMLSSLETIGFFKQSNNEYMKNFWKSIFTRSVLSQSEASYIEKTFSKIAGLALRNKNNISGSDN